MINKKIALSALTIVISLSLMAGATYAFFTDTAQSTGNTFTTGSLDVTITDQNADTAFQGEILASNWAPGEETLVPFDVRNDGTLPVQLRGAALGTWGDEELDSQNVVKVTKVERWNGSEWETIGTNSSGFTGYFYYSNGGSEASLFSVEPGGRAQLRLTVVLDSAAGEAFEDRDFTSSLIVEAKQVTAGAEWPTI